MAIFPKNSLSYQLRIGLIVLLAPFMAASPIMADKKEPSVPAGMMKPKHPGVALFLSSPPMIPGGQIYNGQYHKAMAMTGAQLWGYLILISNFCIECRYSDGSGGAVGVLMVLFSYAWQVADAPISAHKINKKIEKMKMEKVNIVPHWINGPGMRLAVRF